MKFLKDIWWLLFGKIDLELKDEDLLNERSLNMEVKNENTPR